jgi:hypothetical protein
MNAKFLIGACVIILLLMGGFFLLPSRSSMIAPGRSGGSAANVVTGTEGRHTVAALPPFDPAAYDAKLRALAHLPNLAHATTSPASTLISSSTRMSSSTASRLRRPWPESLWPVKTIYPNPGAILPMNRIVAYYGNPSSKQMGVLGEYPEVQMLAMLASTTAMWQGADPTTPVVPALDYIAVTAQGSPGPDGMYRLRMPDDQVQAILRMADQIHGVVFLDVQVGLSNVQTEIPLLERYLKLPQVYLSIDPEFSMKGGGRPGTVIGTMDAADVNFAAQYLAKLVRDNNVPPKILVVHRFTEGMLTNYQTIKPLPEVQIVMDMDGFASPAKKVKTYRTVVSAEPVQFTGFKLFYKNDVNVGGHLMAPGEVLRLIPAPSYIQYQ